MSNQQPTLKGRPTQGAEAFRQFYPTFDGAAPRADVPKSTIEKRELQHARMTVPPASGRRFFTEYGQPENIDPEDVKALLSYPEHSGPLVEAIASCSHDAAKQEWQAVKDGFVAEPTAEGVDIIRNSAEAKAEIKRRHREARSTFKAALKELQRRFKAPLARVAGACAESIQSFIADRESGIRETCESIGARYEPDVVIQSLKSLVARIADVESQAKSEAWVGDPLHAIDWVLDLTEVSE